MTIENKELDDEKMSELQRDLGFRLTAACLSLCHNSQIAEIDGQWSAIGDPTDSACAVLGYKINGSVFKEFAQRHPRKHEFFFNTDRKRMSVIHEYEGEDWIFSKGGAGGFRTLVNWKVSNGKIVAIEDGDFE